MSRGDGFEIADTDTGMLSDPKVVALARRLRDAAKTMTAIGLYDAVRLGSWGCGRRLTLEETLPGWWLDPIDEWVAHLIAVGLLDDEHRIPEHAWQGWYGPAFARRQRYRDLGSRGGLAAHRDPVERTVERTVEPVRSVPTVPSVPSRGEHEPRRFEGATRTNGGQPDPRALVDPQKVTGDEYQRMLRAEQARRLGVPDTSA